jgi:hypothetical protein
MLRGAQDLAQRCDRTYDVVAMPRSGSISADVVKVLRKRPDGATMSEIRSDLAKVRGHVLPHSVRSAVYSHLDDKGEQLFVRVGQGQRSGRYKLSKPDG